MINNNISYITCIPKMNSKHIFLYPKLNPMASKPGLPATPIKTPSFD